MALGKGLGSLIPNAPSSRTVVRKETGGNNSERIWQIPLSEIIPNTHQPRQQFSHAELDDLVASIKEHGVLQPVLVTEHADGGYELIAGERRFRASGIAGLATIPALVRSTTQQQKLEIALIENIQRQNLNPIECAFSYRRLMDEFGLTQEDVSKKVGKSRPSIANTLRLLDLPDAIQRALIDGELSEGKARALLSLKSDKEQMEVFASMQGKQMSVRDVESAVEHRGSASRKGSVRRDPNIAAQERMLEERLGSKVRIAQKGDHGSITIEFHSREELKHLLDILS